MIGFFILLIVIGFFIIRAFYLKSKERPIYYKEYTIDYLFPGQNICTEKAWYSVNDNLEGIWTLSKDDTTIIDDKYVIDWY